MLDVVLYPLSLSIYVSFVCPILNLFINISCFLFLLLVGHLYIQYFISSSFWFSFFYTLPLQLGRYTRIFDVISNLCICMYFFIILYLFWWLLYNFNMFICLFISVFYFISVGVNIKIIKYNIIYIKYYIILETYAVILNCVFYRLIYSTFCLIIFK